MGGQSIPALDYYLAPGIIKTYRKMLISNMAKHIEITMNLTEYVSKQAAEVAVDATQGLSIELSEEDQFRVAEVLKSAYKQYTNKDKSRDIYDTIQFAMTKAYQETDKRTYQAMEALIHNLNTMQCLPGSERLWVYDAAEGELKMVEIGELHNNFAKDRYYAISLNNDTGKSEFKVITETVRKDNNRRLITITTKAGQKVTTTDNHEIKTFKGTMIGDGMPEDIDKVISPRFIDIPAGFSIDEIDLRGYGEVYSNTVYQADILPVTVELAELLGYYVADGSITGGTSMCMTTAGKVPFAEMSDLAFRAFDTEFKENYTGYMHESGVEVEKDIRIGVGTRIANMLKDICGENAHNKKVPQVIMLGSKEIQKAFLRAYYLCDGSIKNYADASSVSKDLTKQIGLMIMGHGELPHYAQREPHKNSKLNARTGYEVSIGGMATNRMGLDLGITTNMEIPNYTLGFIRDSMDKWTKHVPNRAQSKEVRMHELEKYLKHENNIFVEHLVNTFPVAVTNTEESNSGEEYVYDISVADNENFLTEDGIYVHNSRAGSQVPFSSVNYGTDTSPEGRMLVKNLLEATKAGLGDGETPIFPIQIFKVKTGINLNPGDPNYELFKLACETSSTRLFPNFSFLDAPFNEQYYKPNNPDTEVAYMGCRTRVVANAHDKDNEIVTGRGNLSFTSINLPRMALNALSKFSLAEDRLDINEPESIVKAKLLSIFMEELEETLALTIRQLDARFKFQSAKKAKNYPFLMGEGLHLGSDDLEAEDTLEEVLKHGTLSIGFIGLAETLVGLTGKHHAECEESQKLGLEIIGFMREYVDKLSEEYKLNYTLIGTPAEGLSGRFVDMDREIYGKIEGITDREYYTNSFHVPVHYKLKAHEKIDIEAPYHALTNAGHITYVELDGNMRNNPEAFEKVIRYMSEKGIGYGSVNHPVDRDPVCGYTGIIGDTCPKCGRTEEEGPKFDRIRRITGYLVGTVDRFNDAKQAEVRDRVKHI